MVKGSSFAHEDKAVQVSLSIGPHVEVQAESAEVTSPGQLVSAVSLRAEADVLIAQLSLKVEQMRKLESESKKKRAETFAHDPSLVAGSCSAVVDGDGNDKADVVRAVAASCGAVDHSSSPNLCDERPETFAHVTSLAAGCGSAVVDGNNKADVVRAVAASSAAMVVMISPCLFVQRPLLMISPCGCVQRPLSTILPRLLPRVLIVVMVMTCPVCAQKSKLMIHPYLLPLLVQLVTVLSLP